MLIHAALPGKDLIKTIFPKAIIIYKEILLSSFKVKI